MEREVGCSGSQYKAVSKQRHRYSALNLCSVLNSACSETARPEWLQRILVVLAESEVQSVSSG